MEEGGNRSKTPVQRVPRPGKLVGKILISGVGDLDITPQVHYKDGRAVKISNFCAEIHLKGNGGPHRALMSEFVFDGKDDKIYRVTYDGEGNPSRTLLDPRMLKMVQAKGSSEKVPILDVLGYDQAVLTKAVKGKKFGAYVLGN